MCDDKNSTLSLAFSPKTRNHSQVTIKTYKAKLRNILQNNCQGHEKQGKTENLLIDWRYGNQMDPRTTTKKRSGKTGKICNLVDDNVPVLVY